MHFRATFTHCDHLNKSSLLILYWRLKGKKKVKSYLSVVFKICFFKNPHLSEIYLHKLRTARTKSEKNTDRN